MEALLREFLIKLGEEPDREGLMKTPERVAEAFSFLTSGLIKLSYTLSIVFKITLSVHLRYLPFGAAFMRSLQSPVRLRSFCLRVSRNTYPVTPSAISHIYERPSLTAI